LEKYISYINYALKATDIGIIARSLLFLQN